MIYIGSRKEVFFDDFLIDREKSTAELRLNKPIPAEIVMEFDEDWEINTSYIHFFRDDDRFRMYYIAWNQVEYFRAKEGDAHKKIRLCYAESQDGLHWTKPELGICEWNGSKKNNIVFTADWLDNMYVFRDENPNCPADEKYKAIAKDKEGLTAYFSEDGTHFRYGRLITNEGTFDTLNIILWDPNDKKYKGYIRSFHNLPLEGGGDFMDWVRAGNDAKIIPGIDTDDEHILGAGILNLGIRDIRYIESEDFIRWSAPKLLDFGDKADLPLYTNNVSVYENAPHIFIGFPTRYHERKRWTKSFDVLCGKEERLQKINEFARRIGLAITDCLFMVSRDGYHFTRYDEAFFANAPEYGTNWIYGDCYPAKGILKTKSTFRGADDEFSMFVPEITDTHDQLRRYIIRQDGFCSVYAGEQEKILVTKPFVFEGKALFANMATSAYGHIDFALEDSGGNQLTGCEMFGNSIRKQIGFDEDLTAFSGKTVVLTATMSDANLYAIQFE